MKVYFILFFHKKNEHVLRVRKVQTNWAINAFKLLGIKLHRSGAEIIQSQGIFTPNHISFLDIVLAFAYSPVVFVSKIEVSKWPLIGPAAKAVGTIFVKRDSTKSRAEALTSIADQAKEHKRLVAIFPDGTTLLEPNQWKYGAFRLAQDSGLYVQPCVIDYTPLRDSAYIEDDDLFPQLWKLLDHKEKHAYFHVFEARKITNYKEDSKEIKEMVHAKLLDMRKDRANQ